MTIPEIVLLDTLQSALTFVRTDYADQVDKSKSYLALLFGSTQLERYGFLEQAETVICGPDDDPRRFEIDLMFNAQRQGAPTAHITLPAESTGIGNGIGTDEGYEQSIIEPGDPDHDIPGSLRPIFSRALQATYNIVITSDNPNEVILLFHFLRALLIAVIPHLHENNIYNVSFGGQDIQPYAELANQLYMRAVTVSLQYNTQVPSIFVKEMAHKIVVDGKPVI